jgi:hypothetical protein
VRGPCLLLLGPWTGDAEVLPFPSPSAACAAWMAFVRWTSQNCIFYSTVAMAHECCRYRGPAPPADPDEQLVMDVTLRQKLHIHAPKLVLWLLFEGITVARTITRVSAQPHPHLPAASLLPGCTSAWPAVKLRPGPAQPVQHQRTAAAVQSQARNDTIFSASTGRSARLHSSAVHPLPFRSSAHAHRARRRCCHGGAGSPPRRAGG